MPTTRFLSLALTLAAAGAAATTLPAQGPPPQPQRDPAARAEFLRKFDKDGDGRVSREEIEQARASGVLKGNGRKNSKGGPSETKGNKDAAQSDLKNDRLIQKIIDEFDLDRNGKLNFDEMAACREALKKRGDAAEEAAVTDRRRNNAGEEPDARSGEGRRQRRATDNVP